MTGVVAGVAIDRYLFEKNTQDSVLKGSEAKNVSSTGGCNNK